VRTLFEFGNYSSFCDSYILEDFIKVLEILVGTDAYKEFSL
jgi:hypothetical protein